MTILLWLAIAGPVAAQPAFPLGVASGDVTHSGAILWTRAETAGMVRVEVATDDHFAAPILSAHVEAMSVGDLTIRFEATTLSPESDYFYRFIRLDDDASSDVGRFRTAPGADEPSAFRFVYTGDSNAAFFPFSVLDAAADEQPDLWFYAGDIIYADVPAGGLGVAATLDEYRAKYRQSRGDEPLRRLLASSAVWAQWDDHEVRNDYDGGDLEPSITPQRLADGYQAFFEYLPVRRAAAETNRLYRSFRYGGLAEFFILDGRQYRDADIGRVGGGLDPYAFALPSFELETVMRLHEPGRSMLGLAQRAWLEQGLRASTARWKFVLSSVPFTSLLLVPYDRWDGYPVERYDLLRFVDRERIEGVVLLSADIHGNVYNPDVTHLLRTTFGQAFSPGFYVPEFVAGPVATDTAEQEIREFGASFAAGLPGDVASSPFFEAAFRTLLAQVSLRNRLAFLDGNRFGYLVVDVTPDGATFTHRGLPPGGAAAEIETLHSVRLDPPATRACCGAGWWPGIVGVLGGCRRWRRPRGSFPASLQSSRSALIRTSRNAKGARDLTARAGIRP